MRILRCGVYSGKRGKRGFREEGEKKIGIREIRKIIIELKKGKAAGENGLQNKVWMFGGKKVEKWTWKFCNKGEFFNKVWRMIGKMERGGDNTDSQKGRKRSSEKEE